MYGEGEIYGWMTSGLWNAGGKVITWLEYLQGSNLWTYRFNLDENKCLIQLTNYFTSILNIIIIIVIRIHSANRTGLS